MFIMPDTWEQSPESVILILFGGQIHTGVLLRYILDLPAAVFANSYYKLFEVLFKRIILQAFD